MIFPFVWSFRDFSKKNSVHIVRCNFHALCDVINFDVVISNWCFQLLVKLSELYQHLPCSELRKTLKSALLSAFDYSQRYGYTETDERCKFFSLNKKYAVSDWNVQIMQKRTSKYWFPRILWRIKQRNSNKKLYKKDKNKNFLFLEYKLNHFMKKKQKHVLWVSNNL